jgi:hypothetical protein
MNYCSPFNISQLPGMQVNYTLCNIACVSWSTVCLSITLRVVLYVFHGVRCVCQLYFVQSCMCVPWCTVCLLIILFVVLCVFHGVRCICQLYFV